MASCLVAALYHFVPMPGRQALQAPLKALCRREGVCGTLLLAHEGINGTIAGPPSGVHAVLAFLRGQPGLAGLEHKESWASHPPFQRMKVKLKREIVTMGVADLDPPTMAGEYVPPQEWNALISQPGLVLVDVRNDYEVAMGSFESAVNPHTATFSGFPAWVRQQSAEGGLLEGRPPVAMFCTGGIRCEKSTAYLRSLGFDQVYHLQGGILNYLQAIAPEKSRWRGACYVFDEREAVDHHLRPVERAEGH